MAADRVWLATGTTPDITTPDYLTDLVADLPIADGYPIIDEALRLGSHPIYVMGRLATSTNKVMYDLNSKSIWITPTRRNRCDRQHCCVHVGRRTARL